MSADRVYGHDLSGWNPVDGPDRERPGESYCIVKISQGERISKYAEPHCRRARISGMALSGYHFADPRKKGKGRAKQQAETFVTGLELCHLSSLFTPDDMIPWLDMEWISWGKSKAGKLAGRLFRRQFPASLVMDWTDEFCERVNEILGVTPGVYSGRSFIRYRFRHNPRLARYHLWLASYVKVGKDRRGVPPEDYLPEPVILDEWGEWPVSLHQFTGRGRCDWYGKGKIDRNVIYDDRGLDLLRVGAQ